MLKICYNLAHGNVLKKLNQKNQKMSITQKNVLKTENYQSLSVSRDKFIHHSKEENYKMVQCQAANLVNTQAANLVNTQAANLDNTQAANLVNTQAANLDNTQAANLVKCLDLKVDNKVDNNQANNLVNNLDNNPVDNPNKDHNSSTDVLKLLIKSRLLNNSVVLLKVLNSLN